MHRQHRQRWEKRPFEITGSLIFGSLWESEWKYDKKITLGFWGSLYIRSSWMKLDKMGWNETIIVYEYFWSQDFFVHWSFGFFRDICPFECGQKHLCRIYEMSIAPCNLYTRWGRLDNVWFGGFAIENDAIMHRPKILGCSDKLRQICPQYAKRPKFRRCLFL